MLQRKTLYFRRIDSFEDQFEGYYTEAMHRNFETYVEMLKLQLKDTKLNDDDIRLAVRRSFELSKTMRTELFANCWHMNYEESHAMWRLYTMQSESIAICTRFDKLFDLLPSSCMLGAVTYIDYKEDIIQIGNTLYPAMHKRKSYEHEKEVRAVYWKDYQMGNSNDADFPDDRGCYIKINVENLIEKIYVSPNSSAEFAIVVENVARNYGVSSKILRSEVNAPPGY